MSDLERVWEECWARVAQGEATVQDCLNLYPEYASELSRLFGAVARLKQGRAVRPARDYKARARADLISHIHARSRESKASRVRLIPWTIRIGFAFAVVLMFLLVSSTMLAQAALPGDALYDLKIGSEQVWRSVHPDPLTADLILTDRRADELSRVVGTPAEKVVETRYQQILTELPRFTDPSAQGKIRQELTEQKNKLQKAGASVPAIDRTLSSLAAAPTVVLSPTASPTPSTIPSPTASLAPSPIPSPTASRSASPTAPSTRQTATKQSTTRTVTPTAEPSATASATQTPVPSATSTLTPTSMPTPTPRGNRPATRTPRPSRTTAPAAVSTPGADTPSRTATPTATPCVTNSPLRMTEIPCPTPSATSGPCATAPSTLSPFSCETPTRTATPTMTVPPPTETPTVTPAPTQVMPPSLEVPTTGLPTEPAQ